MQIKEGLQKEYEAYVEKNSKDDYSKGVIDATEAFGTAVDEEKTFDEADKIMCEKVPGLTGFMAGCVMEVMVKYHPRGKEIQPWWNKKCGGTGTEDGVINPAVFRMNV